MGKRDYGDFILMRNNLEQKKRRNMNGYLVKISLIFIILVLFSAPLLAEQKKEDVKEYLTLKIPLLSERFSKIPLAVINGEEITVEDLRSIVGPDQEDHMTEKRPEKLDYSQILKRLINLKLIVEEARRIGIDELPEVKSLIDIYSRATLRDMFLDELGKDVKVKDEEVESLYKEIVKEWKIKSLLFEKEEDAQRMLDEIKAGKDFDELLQKAISDKIAKGNKEGIYIKAEDLHPLVKDAISKMDIGAISPIIKVGTEGKVGYTIVKLEDIRYPENPEKRIKAKETVLGSKRIEAIKDFKKIAYKKYVRIEKKVFDSLDYDSKKVDLPKLLKDKRVIARIKGEKPITVKDFTEQIKSKFFHGVERAIEGKKVNKRKQEVLEEMIDKILFKKEAIKRGIDKSDKYKRLVNEYSDSVIFSYFINRVVVPEIKVDEDDIKAYYDEHKDDFTYPEMIKIDKIVFMDKKNAELAIDKLNKGADFKWVKANIEGQASSETEGLLPFQGKFLIRKDLSEDITKALSGVKIGDARLYEDPKGYFYVLYIQDIVPSKMQPLEEVRVMIYRKLYNQRLNKSVEEWAEKLRESAEIEVFLSGLEK